MDEVIEGIVVKRYYKSELRELCGFGQSRYHMNAMIEAAIKKWCKETGKSEADFGSWKYGRLLSQKQVRIILQYG